MARASCTGHTGISAINPFPRVAMNLGRLLKVRIQGAWGSPGAPEYDKIDIRNYKSSRHLRTYRREFKNQWISE